MLSSTLTSSQFVQQSLELNLFFLRIMKEHSFFLEAGFVGKDKKLIARAERFKNEFTILLRETVRLANGNVSRAVLVSEEVVTDKTRRAELKTQKLTGVHFDTALTVRERQLVAGKGDPALAPQVSRLNERAIALTRRLIKFKTLLLNEMLTCKIFTYNFPLLIRHVRREAIFFVKHLERLQQRRALSNKQVIIEEKLFWDRIMAEHSLFIAHLLDPTEKTLIHKADAFANEFFRLRRSVMKAQNGGMTNSKLKELVQKEIAAARAIAQFKNTADAAILDCKIESIIIPLLADHVLREADHFLRILKQSEYA
jgi:hypothetical protein